MTDFGHNTSWQGGRERCISDLVGTWRNVDMPGECYDVRGLRGSGQMLEARANLPFIGIAAYAGGVGVLMADCSSCGLPMMQLRGCQSRPLVRKIPVHGVGNDASTSGHLRPHQAATVIQAMSRGGEVVTTKGNGPQPQDGCEGAGAATGITGAIIVANAVDVADTAAGIAGVAELKVTIGTTTQAGGLAEASAPLPCGLTQREFHDLLFREITPEDYEMLLRLDASVAKPSVAEADAVTASLDKLPLLTEEEIKDS
eukprot:CAMPEP_0169389628 /NCGR_PEP_ID=MMETSP1017-20121227/46842_1 /TAXON_ID=342587 /ORGANISM="Karlodinium micrum, Strain CCMP2283" /LENGTH=256 /DNA_ID=CAMNT_0009491825 /DNA_START=8 /DNA_END=775 /DNA_ORIENTATION=-